MENRKKITLIVGIIAFVLALAVFLVAYHWPQKMVWSGMMRPDGAGEDIPEALIEADLTRWNRLFSEDDKIDGSITIDGEKYVYHKPANDPDHPEIAVLIPEAKKASPTEWLEDFVTVQMKEHDTLQISRKRGNEAQVYNIAFAVTKEG